MSVYISRIRAIPLVVPEWPMLRSGHSGWLALHWVADFAAEEGVAAPLTGALAVLKQPTYIGWASHSSPAILWGFKSGSETTRKDCLKALVLSWIHSQAS